MTDASDVPEGETEREAPAGALAFAATTLPALQILVGASGGVAWRQLAIRSVRSSTSSTSASRPTARLLTCTTA